MQPAFINMLKSDALAVLWPEIQGYVRVVKGSTLKLTEGRMVADLRLSGLSFELLKIRN